MYPELKIISTQIRKLRTEQGLTQQELAERSNLSLPFINRLENNPKNLSIETLLKILDVLDVSLSDFFLPFSKEIDETTQELILTVQSSKHKQTISENILNILKIINE